VIQAVREPVSTRHRTAGTLALGALVVGSYLVLPASARADVRSEVKAGKIVTMSLPGSGLSPGRAMGTVEASAERVYRALSDVSAYPEFIPRVKKSRRLAGKDAYEVTAKFPWPVSETRIEIKLNKGRRGNTYVLRWKRVGGDLRDYEGQAWIQPWGKDRCVLTYQMIAVPSIPAPSGLMNRGLRNAAKRVIKAVRKHINQETALAGSPTSPG